MKHRFTLLSILSVLILVTSCVQTHDVASPGPVTKRKYRKGWHFEGLFSKEHSTRSIAHVIGNTSPVTDSSQTITADTDHPVLTDVTNDAVKTDTLDTEGLLHQGSPMVGSTEELTMAPVEETRKGRKKAPLQTMDEDPYAERIEFYGLISLGIAGAVFTLLWIVPLLNILLTLAGIVFGVMAISGGETLNGSLGVAANAILLIWSILWTLFLLLPFLL